MAVERRTLWLGGALLVTALAAVVVRSLDTGTTPGRTGPRARPAAAAAPDPQEAPVDIKLDALRVTRGEPADRGRNPFQFRARATEPAAPAAATPTTAARLPVGTPTISAAPSGPPPPPPILLKFIGIVEKADGTRIAVLSDGRRPYHGVEGQELEGQYRILKIGVESLEISYLDGRGRQTIRLSGK
jgi:hypothetical protein